MLTHMGSSRLTILPADAPEACGAPPHEPPKQLPPEEEAAIWEAIKKHAPEFPRIIPDTSVPDPEQDERLTQRVPTHNNRVLSVVSLARNTWSRADENLEQAKFMAGKYGADVLIRRMPDNHLFIYARPELNLRFDVLRSILRMQEEPLHRKYRARTPWDKLTWRYFDAKGLMINGEFGGKPSPYPPTLLPLDRIREWVRLIVNPNAFYRTRERECRRGVCTSHYLVKHDRCPYQALQLPQCQNIRMETWDAPNTMTGDEAA